MPTLFLILLATDVIEPVPSACREVGDMGISNDNRFSHTVTSSDDAKHEDKDGDGDDDEERGADSDKGAE